MFGEFNADHLVESDFQDKFQLTFHGRTLVWDLDQAMLDRTEQRLSKVFEWFNQLPIDWRRRVRFYHESVDQYPTFYAIRSLYGGKHAQARGVLQEKLRTEGMTYFETWDAAIKSDTP